MDRSTRGGRFSPAEAPAGPPPPGAAMPAHGALGGPGHAPRLSCRIGEAPGFWRGLEWQLHLSERCPTQLRRYVSVAPSSCAAKAKGASGFPTSLPSCTERRMALLDELRNSSILLLGDSTSAQLLMHSCDAFSSSPKSFIAVPQGVDRGKYHHRLRSLDNHACRLLRHSPGGGLGLPIGSFSHFGVTGPPYWAFAYPLPTWLANTTVGQVEADLPNFGERYTAGADPSVVVAGSGFWDIASWWMHDGNFSKNWAAGPGYIPQYVAGVTAFVEALRGRFPRSRVLWRTMHPGHKHSIEPHVVSMFNEAVRARASDMRLPLLDVERMIRQLSPLAPPPRFPRPLAKEHGAPYGTMDGRHLHEWLNIALLNVLLNIVRQAEKPRAHAAWHNASSEGGPTGRVLPRRARNETRRVAGEALRAHRERWSGRDEVNMVAGEEVSEPW